MAIAGLVIGWQFPLSEMADQFFLLYTPLYRMLAFPFLCLTVIFAIGRLSGDTEDQTTTRRIVLVMPVLMFGVAAVAMTVTAIICWLRVETARSGIGSLIAAFDKSVSNFLEVSLNEPDSGQTLFGRFAEVIGSFLPDNLFAALDLSNYGQVIVFLIIFSLALLGLLPPLRRTMLDAVEAARRPFEHLLSGMQLIVPFAAFFYAIHASHLVAARDFSGMQLLFTVVAGSAVTIVLLFVLFICIVTRRSPFAVAAEARAAVFAGVLSMTDEAALPVIVRALEHEGASHKDAKEVVASLALSIGRFGMIALVASVLTFVAAIYEVPISIHMTLSILMLSILTGALATGINGPGVFAAAIGFAGSTLGLPVEAILVLVIVLEPLLEFFLIPVAIIAAYGLVSLVRPLPQASATQAQDQ
jgi:Na+/H+-dicarboxylate symporter